jgi:hypothetical protein
MDGGFERDNKNSLSVLSGEGCGVFKLFVTEREFLSYDLLSEAFHLWLSL